MQPEIIEALAELQVRRVFYIRRTNMAANAAKALVRRALGWRYDEEEVGRKAVNKRASRIVSAALSGEEQRAEDAAIAERLAVDLEVIRQMMEPAIKARHQIELEMKRQSRKLPVHGWTRDPARRGLGELGLAVIVGEAGDLHGYPKKGHLWKRMGLAPYHGWAASTWRREGGLSADEWTKIGYKPARRAEMFAVVAEPLFRQQTMIDGEYRKAYDARRAHTAQTHPDWSKGRSHMDALRIMTKRLLRDLWQAWRDERKASDGLPVTANLCMPTAQPDAGEVNTCMPNAMVNLPSPHPNEGMTAEGWRGLTEPSHSKAA